MTRFGRIAAVAIVLAGALFLSRFSVPRTVVACSCAMPGPIAELKGRPDLVVAAGTILSIDNNAFDNNGHTFGQLAILRLYQGPEGLPAQVQIVGGGGGDCTIPIEAGQQLFFVATIEDGGRLRPGLCSPLGDLRTPEGQALVQEAEAVFGAGVGPPAADPDAGIDLALISILAVGGIFTVVLFGIVLSFVRRDREAAP